MKMSVHALAMETYVPALRTLSELLDKGVEHSKAKGIDAAALLKERLAPDMFPLINARASTKGISLLPRIRRRACIVVHYVKRGVWRLIAGAHRLAAVPKLGHNASTPPR